MTPREVKPIINVFGLFRVQAADDRIVNAQNVYGLLRPNGRLYLQFDELKSLTVARDNRCETIEVVRGSKISKDLSGLHKLRTVTTLPRPVLRLVSRVRSACGRG